MNSSRDVLPAGTLPVITVSPVAWMVLPGSSSPVVVGHACVLQGSDFSADPLHCLPPQLGAGAVHVRVDLSAPVPHVLSQTPACHAVQPPSTGLQSLVHLPATHLSWALGHSCMLVGSTKPSQSLSMPSHTSLSGEFIWQMPSTGLVHVRLPGHLPTGLPFASTCSTQHGVDSLAWVAEALQRHSVISPTLFTGTQ